MTDRSFLAAAVLAAGIAIGGGLVGWGFARGRTADRYVEVKGLAERKQPASEDRPRGVDGAVSARLNLAGVC